MRQWANTNGVALKLIEPEKPTQHPFIESFNRRFHDECLNDHWFTSLTQARMLLATWRHDYNEQRSHGALDYLSPAEFAARHRVSSPDDGHKQSSK